MPHRRISSASATVRGSSSTAWQWTSGGLGRFRTRPIPVWSDSGATHAVGAATGAPTSATNLSIDRNLPVNDSFAGARQIKLALDRAGNRILAYTGLDVRDDLIGAVLAACSDAAAEVAPDADLEEGLRRIADRCQRLIEVTSRFVVRDFELIALSRRRAIAAVDLFQDVITGSHKRAAPPLSAARLLRERAR